MRLLILIFLMAPNLALAENTNRAMREKIIQSYDQISLCYSYLYIWNNFDYDDKRAFKREIQLRLQFEVDEKIYTQKNLQNMAKEFTDKSHQVNLANLEQMKRLSEDEQEYILSKMVESSRKYDRQRDDLWDATPIDLFELSDRIMKCVDTWKVKYN